MGTQTYAGITAEQRSYYVRNLLMRYTPNLTLAKYSQKDTVARRKGMTVNWRKFASLGAATTALTEGVTPAGSALSVSAITANMAQYGDFVEGSDVLDFAAIDPVITETSQLLGEQAALTIDTLIRDVIKAGTNVLYATGSARTDITAADILTSLLIRKARRTLKRNNVPTVDGKYYLGLVHPDAVFDLTGDSAWVNAAQYAGSMKIFEGELGRLWGVRFIESTQAPVWAGAGSVGADVYGTLIFGKQAYGTPKLAGVTKPDLIIKPLGSAGTSDPLNQRWTIGWKAAHVTKRLQEEALVRIEHGATT